jgi:hypothetical protein
MERAHLVQPDGDTTARGLPRGFAAGQSGSDDDQGRQRFASGSGLHGRAQHNALQLGENEKPAVAILGDDALEFQRKQLLSQ